MTIPFEAFREKLLKNPKVRAEYDRLGPVYEMVGALIEARHEAGLTQSQLASLMGTKQSVIARLENAHRLPSLEMVMRYASAVGRRIALE